MNARELLKTFRTLYVQYDERLRERSKAIAKGNYPGLGAMLWNLRPLLVSIAIGLVFLAYFIRQSIRFIARKIRERRERR